MFGPADRNKRAARWLPFSKMTISHRSHPSRPPSNSARSAACVLAAALLLVLGIVPAASAAPASVYVYPIPGGRVASPQTQITFRGAPVSQLGSVIVVGSRSGAHRGRLAAHSDGHGASFIPTKPFAPGERVTVKSSVSIIGGQGNSFQFITAKPAPAFKGPSLPPIPRLRGDTQRFQSRPDLRPVAIKILKPSADPSAGDVFVGPQNGPVQNGPMLFDPSGRLIWFKAISRGTLATDFRTQTLRGSPVLTWWQGILNARVGTGKGKDVIADSSYHQLYSIDAGNGLRADLHEFELTPQGTALISSYYPVVWDARSIHRSSQAAVLDSVVQEIDIKTGLVLYQWDSLDHVPLTDSYAARPRSAKQAFDYFHINSIQQDSDNNLVVSARNTWAGYKIDHRTDALIWVLGGRRSSFKMGRGAQFAFQHDIRMRSAQIASIFDDGAGDTVVHRQSRGLTLSLDFARHTAEQLVVDQHSPGLLAFFEGNLQVLPSGNVLLGWGQQPYFTEFDPRGKVVFDGRFVDANSSYRAFRFPWNGAPRTRPAVATHVSGSRTAVYVSWNGATNVSSWRILGGASGSTLSPLLTVAKRDFETRAVIGTQRYVAVQALDSGGRILTGSSTVRAH